LNTFQPKKNQSAENLLKTERKNDELFYDKGRAHSVTEEFKFRMPSVQLVSVMLRH
jgi:hypothetical protein